MLADRKHPATKGTENVLARLAVVWPVDIWRDVTTLIAVSGGADSTALLRALAALRAPGEGRLIVVHFNHQLRGAESDADEDFVRELANSLGLAIEIGYATEPSGRLVRPTALGPRMSEEGAREVRYQFFVEAARRWGARYVVTAHTSDDQIETVLHRIFRGTGIAGLAGIPRVRSLTEMTSMVRPMLSISREEVLAYLHSLKQEYRVDASNTGDDFTRNRLRNELLPWIETRVHPGARDAILRLMEQAGEQTQYLQTEASSLLERCLAHRTKNEVILNSEPLVNAPPLVIRQMFVEIWRRQGWPEQAMGAVEWQRLANWTQNDANVTPTLPSGIQATKTAGKLTLAGPVRN